MLAHGLGVEEEGRAGEGLREEVGREERDPLEDAEAGAGLEDEQRDGLLNEQTHDDSRPTCTNVSTQSRSIASGSDQGTWERRVEVAQKQNWKMKRPATEIARSP